MDALFAKLNYREGHTLFVLNPPEMFESILATVPAGITVKKEVSANDTVEFVIGFATRRAELEELARIIAPTLTGDAIVWLAYPKGTSKKYTCDFNRDTSWQALAPYKLLAVRQVSIDADWSALRFRKAMYIKSLSRKNML